MNGTQNFYHFTVCKNMKNYVTAVQEEHIGGGEIKKCALDLASSLRSFLDYAWEDYKEIISEKYSVNSRHSFLDCIHTRNTYKIGGLTLDNQIIKLVFNVCNAGKHSINTNKNPIITHENQVFESPIALQHSDEHGHYYTFHKCAAVRLGPNTRQICLSDKLFSVWVIFSQLFIDIGGIDKMPSAEGYMINYSRRRSESYLQPKPKVLSVKNQPLQLGVVIMIYDPEYPYGIREMKKEEPFTFKLEMKGETFNNVYDLINYK